MQAKASIIILFCFIVNYVFCQNLEKSVLTNNNYNSFSNSNNNFSNLLNNISINANHKLSENSHSIYMPVSAYCDENTNRHLYTYDSNGNLLKDLYETKNNGNWLALWCYNYTYDLNDRITSSIYQDIDWSTRILVNEEKITYTYTGSNLTLILYLIWDKEQNTWANFSQFVFQYDNFSNNIFKLHQSWNNSEWTDTYKYYYTYNNDKQILTKGYETFDNLSNTWRGEYFITYTYETSGKLLNELHEKWINGNKVNESQISYAYNSTGVLSFEIEEYWDNNCWNNFKKISFVYDTNNYLLVKKTEYFYNNQWFNSSRYNYTYNAAGKLLSFQVDLYTSITGWKNYSLLINTYDDNDNLLNSIQQFWQNDIWVNNSQTSFTYDNYDNAITGKFETWNSSSGTWLATETGFSVPYNHGNDSLSVICSHCVIEYSLFSSINDERSNNITFTLSQNYPNPFNPSTTISFDLPNSEFVTLKVYDVLGREITTLVNEELYAGQHTKVFNAENLSSGVYFYKLQAGNFSETRKMILTK